MSLQPTLDHHPAETVDYYLEGKPLVRAGPLEGADRVAYLAQRRKLWRWRQFFVIAMPSSLVVVLVLLALGASNEALIVTVLLYIVFVIASAPFFFLDALRLARNPGEFVVYDVGTTDQDGNFVQASLVMPDLWLLKFDGAYEVVPHEGIQIVTHTPEAAYGLRASEQRMLTVGERAEIARGCMPSNLEVSGLCLFAILALTAPVILSLSRVPGMVYVGIVGLVFIVLGPSWLRYIKKLRLIRRTLRNPRVRCERDNDGWREILVATGMAWTIEGQPADWRKTEDDPGA